MLAVIARMKVLEGKAEDFIAVMKELGENVRGKEKGCLQYELYRAKEDNTFVVVERYADKEAIRAHNETSYFADAMTKLKGCLAGRAQLDVLTKVE
jgi:quinol monooxygenase YgiN